MIYACQVAASRALHRSFTQEQQTRARKARVHRLFLAFEMICLLHQTHPAVSSEAHLDRRLFMAGMATPSPMPMHARAASSTCRGCVTVGTSVL